MLAYTAVDGLRAISRDFDLNWQPDVRDDLPATRRDWHTSFQSSQRLGRYSFAALVALLPFPGIWLR